MANNTKASLRNMVMYSNWEVFVIAGYAFSRFEFESKKMGNILLVS